MSTGTESEEIEHIRSVSPEHFSELCLMHLTFALELGSHELNRILSTKSTELAKAKKVSKPMTPFSKRKNARRSKSQ